MFSSFVRRIWRVPLQAFLLVFGSTRTPNLTWYPSFDSESPHRTLAVSQVFLLLERHPSLPSESHAQGVEINCKIVIHSNIFSCPLQVFSYHSITGVRNIEIAYFRICHKSVCLCVYLKLVFHNSLSILEHKIRGRYNHIIFSLTDRYILFTNKRANDHRVWYWYAMWLTRGGWDFVITRLNRIKNVRVNIQSSHVICK